jgi:hypothetical protein
MVVSRTTTLMLSNIFLASGQDNSSSSNGSRRVEAADHQVSIRDQKKKVSFD